MTAARQGRAHLAAKRLLRISTEAPKKLDDFIQAVSNASSREGTWFGLDDDTHPNVRLERERFRDLREEGYTEEEAHREMGILPFDEGERMTKNAKRSVSMLRNLQEYFNAEQKSTFERVMKNSVDLDQDDDRISYMEDFGDLYDEVHEGDFMSADEAENITQAMLFDDVDEKISTFHDRFGGQVDPSAYAKTQNVDGSSEENEQAVFTETSRSRYRDGFTGQLDLLDVEEINEIDTALKKALNDGINPNSEWAPKVILDKYLNKEKFPEKRRVQLVKRFLNGQVSSRTGQEMLLGRIAEEIDDADDFAPVLEKITKELPETTEGMDVRNAAIEMYVKATSRRKSRETLESAKKKEERGTRAPRALYYKEKTAIYDIFKRPVNHRQLLNNYLKHRNRFLEFGISPGEAAKLSEKKLKEILETTERQLSEWFTSSFIQRTNRNETPKMRIRDQGRLNEERETPKNQGEKKHSGGGARSAEQKLDETYERLLEARNDGILQSQYGISEKQMMEIEDEYIFYKSGKLPKRTSVRKKEVVVRS